MLPPPQTSTLFPYTTLFRSEVVRDHRRRAPRVLAAALVDEDGIIGAGGRPGEKYLSVPDRCIRIAVRGIRISREEIAELARGVPDHLEDGVGPIVDDGKHVQHAVELHRGRLEREDRV